MLAERAAPSNIAKVEREAKSVQKREGADSQNVVHFAGSAEHSPAFARGSRAPAGAAHRDRKTC
jgi:hypothetical protein